MVLSAERGAKGAEITSFPDSVWWTFETITTVGYGDFVREYNGRYGLGLIIRLDNWREWFAPINEFTRVR